MEDCLKSCHKRVVQISLLYVKLCVDQWIHITCCLDDIIDLKNYLIHICHPFYVNKFTLSINHNRHFISLLLQTLLKSDT